MPTKTFQVLILVFTIPGSLTYTKSKYLQTSPLPLALQLLVSVPTTLLMHHTLSFVECFASMRREVENMGNTASLIHPAIYVLYHTYLLRSMRSGLGDNFALLPVQLLGQQIFGLPSLHQISSSRDLKLNQMSCQMVQSRCLLRTGNFSFI
ncbi:hypothetical protein F5050DRAFT_1224812 [Lentinula boryana]|uniref:Uncharacterized protein n=1 Tax=Lentinula boryana TaxID=40481 RepID=A0ABQ8PZ12_9AGAR|nr:hypothetical protein F5050DRAFT_1224812 [Lentinula boryana]